MNDPLIGTLLGGTYRVVRLLGRGAMGAVYEARHEALSRTVALKVLASSIADQPAAVARLQREATSAAQLGHPNIAAVTDFRASPGEPAFLVMEYIQGLSLEQVLQQTGPMSQMRASCICIQALGALEAAHRAGIVHRDIKPANLMLMTVPGVGEVVRVLDFGVAKVAGSHGLTRDGSIVGSPLYMAPEQAFSDAIDGRADVYSLGATLYQIVAGSPPLDADSLPRLLTMLREQTPMPLAQRVPGLDPAFGAVVDVALRKDPNTRYPTAEAMRLALTPFAAPTADSRGPSFAPAAPYSGNRALVTSTGATARDAGTLPGRTPGLTSGPAPFATIGNQPKRGSAAALAIGLGLFIALAGGAGIGAYAMHSKTTVPTTLSSTAAPVAHPSASLAPATPPNSSESSLVSPDIPKRLPNGQFATPPPKGSAMQPAQGVLVQSTPIVVATVVPVIGAGAGPTPPGASPTYGGYLTSCSLSEGGPYSDLTDVRNAVAQLGGTLNQCAAQGCYQHDPSESVGYLHEIYRLTVTVAGKVVGAGHPGDSCKAMDPCALATLRAAALPKPPGAGTIQIVCSYRERAKRP